jgi:hypothetical protein
LIGWVCKRGDALSLPVLIARSSLIALMIHVRKTGQAAAARPANPHDTNPQRQKCLPNALSCAGLVV